MKLLRGWGGSVFPDISFVLGQKTAVFAAFEAFKELRKRLDSLCTFITHFFEKKKNEREFFLF